VQLDETSFDAWDLARALPSCGASSRQSNCASIRRSERPLRRWRSRNCNRLRHVLRRRLSECHRAWAPVLEPALPVMPRKGHMLTVELPGCCRWIASCARHRSHCFRAAGTATPSVSTVEDAGFDRTSTLCASTSCSAAPPISGRPCARPASPKPGWAFAPARRRPAHHRSTGANRWIELGISGTASCLARARPRSEPVDERRRPEIDLSAFRLGRFVAASV